jgi:predicted lipoprotein
MRFKVFLGLALATGMQMGCGKDSDSDKTPTATGEPDVSVETQPEPVPTDPTPGDGQIPEDVAPASTGSLVGGLRMDQSELFHNLGDGIARKTAAFSQATVKLSEAITSYCENPATNDRTPVRAAWKNAMLRWEELEVFQVGPIAADERKLKKGIYGWPQQAKTCGIDEEVLKASKDPAYTLPIQTDRKGLQALEYLLYEDALASSCTATHPVAREWNALSSAARAQARCAYLKPLVLELQNSAQTVQSVWGTEGSNYLTGTLGKPAAEKAALQSLYENLFYLDSEVKNYKLASPAGHDIMFCPNSPAPCTGAEEFPRSQISREAIQANIAAFTDLMYGFEDATRKRPGGFAALVREVGNEAVATRSEAITRDLMSYFVSQNESLPALITQQNQEDCSVSQISLLCQLRKSINDISGVLKNEYSRILSLTVPADPIRDHH